MKITKLTLKGIDATIEIAIMKNTIIVKGNNGKYIKFDKDITALTAIKEIKKAIAI